MRILSGIQSSGALHIGNYFGMIKPMVELQQKGELFIFIANMHSMTSLVDATQMQVNINNAIADLIALGIDPQRSTLWVQSDVAEVAELTWYLSTVTPLGLLERCHSYKDKIAKGISPNAGLFTYPILMAADILLYQSNLVPVGQDQKQHLEVTRDIAVKFNSTYGEVFTIPQPLIKEDVAVVPGIDGQKMSKSYGNAIEIFLPEKELRKKVMSIVTDSTPVNSPKDPDKSTVFALYKLFAAEENILEMRERFLKGGYGYGDAKKELFKTICEYFRPFMVKRQELTNDPHYIEQIRREGASKARRAAASTLKKVRSLLGVEF